MAQREGVVESLRLRETNAGHPAEPAFSNGRPCRKRRLTIRFTRA
jgi:hypothetical protein